MLGAIIGDMVGSVYEFANTKRMDFPFFSERSTYTDDSIMTVAVAEWLLTDNTHSHDTLERLMVKYASDCPNPMGGYGCRFAQWLFHPDGLERAPYNSWGNGSAMRVAAVGWKFRTLEETEKVAAISASITHDHPEGIKGAQATAAAIFLARSGHSKHEIKEYIEARFGYDLGTHTDEIRKVYGWEDSCQGTVPPAIRAFLDSTDFESAVRIAVSLGGDSDTLACITGGIAEAFYGEIPEDIVNAAMERLPAGYKFVLKLFRQGKDVLIDFPDKATLYKGMDLIDLTYTTTLKASNDRDMQKLVAFAKEHNVDAQYTEKGLCRIDVDDDDEPIDEFWEFAKLAAASFPQMDMVLTYESDVLNTIMYVNNNGVLKNYQPGIMCIYVEDPSDYKTLVDFAGQHLLDHGFEMQTDDAGRIISWEYVYDDESSKGECDAAIAAISAALPALRLVCYNFGKLWCGKAIEKYCYATGGTFEWKNAGQKWDHLISDDYEFYPMPETVSDPLRTFEKMLETARSGNSICCYGLLMILADEEDRDPYWSRLRPEDAGWIRNHLDEDDDELLAVFDECCLKVF